MWTDLLVRKEILNWSMLNKWVSTELYFCDTVWIKWRADGICHFGQNHSRKIISKLGVRIILLQFTVFKTVDNLST